MAEQAADTIFTAPLLIVQQKTKLIEVTNEYTLIDRHGETIGAVRQVDQRAPAKVMRFLGTPADRLLPVKLKVTDADGHPVLVLTRPAKLVRSRLVVEDGVGNELGQIVQRNAVGKKTFSLQADGVELGTLVGQDLWSTEFGVHDRTGAKVAHLANTLDGLSLLDLLSSGANDVFGTADSYVVEVVQPIDQPLRSLVLAAAIAIDVALHQA